MSTQKAKHVIREEFQNTLRKYVGRGRQISALDLAEEIGVSHGTVKNWLSGTTAPNWPEMYCLMQALPEMAAEILDGMGGGISEACPFAMNKNVTDLVAVNAAAMADGDYCERERRAAVPIVRKVIVVLQNFARRYG